jgi:hypothetical protein
MYIILYKMHYNYIIGSDDTAVKNVLNVPAAVIIRKDVNKKVSDIKF